MSFGLDSFLLCLISWLESTRKSLYFALNRPNAAQFHPSSPSVLAQPWARPRCDRRCKAPLEKVARDSECGAACATMRRTIFLALRSSPSVNESRSYRLLSDALDVRNQRKATTQND
ncbi:hypothetical protein BDW66DRAFT_131784 [Aspergillus desertorum]